MNAVFVIRNGNSWLHVRQPGVLKYCLSIDPSRATVFRSVKQAKNAIRSRKRHAKHFNLPIPLNEPLRVVVRPVHVRKITVHL